MGKAKRRRDADAVRSSGSPPRSTGMVVAATRHDFTTGGLLGHDSTSYAINVSERIALAGDVAYACVRTLADAVSDARWGEYIGDERQATASRLIRRPMASWTRRRWLWRVAATLALYNVCHYERIGEDPEGIPLSLVPFRPGQLTVVGDRIMVDNVREISRDRIGTIYRADFPTVSEDVASVLTLAREAFAATWASDAYRADFWENGGAPAVVLTTDQALTDDQADTLRDRWTDRRRNSPGAPAVLSRGAHAEAFGADIATDNVHAAQDRLGAGVARYFGVPAWIVNVASSAGSMVYSNTEQAGLDLVRYTLRGYLGPIEDALSDELPGDSETDRRVASDVSHLTQGTLLDRFNAYQIATGNRPWMTPAEVRAELHLPPDLALDSAGRPAPAMEGIPT